MKFNGKFKLHHIGIAVKSIAAVRQFYEKLGLSVEHEEIIPQEQVKIALLHLEESMLEFLEPIEKDSPVGRFLEKRGEGLHHLAFAVHDIQSVLQQMKEHAIKPVKEEICTGADGHRYFFVHPSSTGGVLLEIVEDSLEIVEELEDQQI